MDRKQKHRKGLHRKRPYKVNFKGTYQNKGALEACCKRRISLPFLMHRGRTDHMKNEEITFLLSEREGAK